jgi:UDP-glucose 4-epimerase
MIPQPMKDQVFLVTGAHGFIGAWVVKRLLEERARVVTFDSYADPRRLRSIIDDDEIESTLFVEGDITDPDKVLSVITEHDVTHIIHLAGLQVPSCRANPRLGALVNVVGTINVFDAATKTNNQVHQIVYASSAAVFGKPEDHAASEHEASSTTSHYGAFKRCNEENARVYFLDSGISSIGLRPLTVYGVGRDFGVTSDPTKAMKAAIVARPFHIRFGGRTDFLFAADCADAFINCARKKIDGAYVFNLHGDTVSIADIVSAIEELAPGARGSITFDDKPMAIPDELDDTALQKMLGEVNHTPYKAGIRATMARFSQLHNEGRLDTSDIDK